jgi:hypothetical protein
MSLFKRRARNIDEGGSGTAGPSPVDSVDVDLAEARAVVVALVQAVGSDSKMRGAVLGLLSACEMPKPSDTRAFMAALSEDRYLTTRPWRWLRAVAIKANEEGENDIAAMAAYWSWGWNATIVPQQTGADLLDIGFDRPPADVLKDLLDQGALAVSRLADAFVVAQTAEPATVTVAMLRRVLPV